MRRQLTGGELARSPLFYVDFLHDLDLKVLLSKNFLQSRILLLQSLLSVVPGLPRRWSKWLKHRSTPQPTRLPHHNHQLLHRPCRPCRYQSRQPGIRISMAAAWIPRRSTSTHPAPTTTTCGNDSEPAMTTSLKFNYQASANRKSRRGAQAFRAATHAAT